MLIATYCSMNTLQALDSAARAIDAYVQSICQASEKYVAEGDTAAPARIAFYESELHKLGLCQADIYSFVSRAYRSSDAK